MVLGIPEAEAREIARTTRKGTYMGNVLLAARAKGLPAHMIRTDKSLDECLWFLEIQSQSWPLILSCDFKFTGRGTNGKLRKSSRAHAVVLWKSEIYDPGESGTLDADCIGHLGDRGIFLREYVLVEHPST